MSYDIDIGDDDFNYTSNLAEFFHDFIERWDNDSKLTGWQSLIGINGKLAARILKGALNKIHEHHDMSKLAHKYNPSNGWGDVYGATLLIARVMAACYENPRKKVNVWY